MAEQRMNTKWLTILGVVQIVTGILAILLPQVAGFAVSTILGIVLLVAGGFQLIGAFQAGSWGAGIGGFLGGVLFLVVGILSIAHPLATLGAVTLIAGMMLIFHGFLQVGDSLELKPQKGWGWVLFGGIVGLILGIMVLFQWPYSAWWFVGTVVGIDLLFSGWSLVAVGGALKDVKNETAQSD